jgi:hypothetical protein
MASERRTRESAWWRDGFGKRRAGTSESSLAEQAPHDSAAQEFAHAKRGHAPGNAAGPHSPKMRALRYRLRLIFAMVRPFVRLILVSPIGKWPSAHSQPGAS